MNQCPGGESFGPDAEPVPGDGGTRGDRFEGLLVFDEEDATGLEIEPTVSRDRPAWEFDEGFSEGEVRP